MGNVSGKSDSHNGNHISRKELDRFQRRCVCREIAGTYVVDMWHFPFACTVDACAVTTTGSAA